MQMAHAFGRIRLINADEKTLAHGVGIGTITDAPVERGLFLEHRVRFKEFATVASAVQVRGPLLYPSTVEELEQAEPALFAAASSQQHPPAPCKIDSSTLAILATTERCRQVKGGQAVLNQFQRSVLGGLATMQGGQRALSSQTDGALSNLQVFT